MINNGGSPCIYSRKETPKPINLERSEALLKKKDQPRSNQGLFTSPNNNADKDTYLNLSIISDDEVECYKKFDGKSVHTNIDNELQLFPKENNLTPEQGIYNGKNKTIEPPHRVRKCKRLPSAKQTGTLCGVP